MAGHRSSASNKTGSRSLPSTPAQWRDFYDGITRRLASIGVAEASYKVRQSPGGCVMRRLEGPPVSRVRELRLHRFIGWCLASTLPRGRKESMIYQWASRKR
jgi:hypothetical protein